MSAKIPATIVTGFLGAGKTTLLRHLIAASRGRRFALLINEFGDIGIDKAIVEGCGDAACTEDIIELANGCICCTVAEDFLPAMQKLLAAPQPPDHILIETSGLALPKPLIQAFLWPDVRPRVTVDGVIAVIDAPALLAGRFAPEAVGANTPRAAHDDPIEELFEDQLAAADLVLLNKSDLLAAAERAAAEALIRAKARPAVKILQIAHGRVAPEILLGLALAAEDDLADRPSHHDGEADHDHDEFESFTLSFAEVPTPDALAERVRHAAAAHDILRVKGFVAVAGKAMRLVLQGVGARVQHYYDRDWAPQEPRRSRLVVIGRAGLDAAAIAALIAPGASRA